MGLFHARARDGVAVVFAVGVLVGGDWGAAIAAMVDSRRNPLSRAAEVGVIAAFALVGGVAGLVVRSSSA
jgi:hypothetical protein